MSATIEELYVKTFTGNMELLLNQGGSILRPLISEEPMTGTGCTSNRSNNLSVYILSYGISHRLQKLVCWVC
jgi:hypothetical protein